MTDLNNICILGRLTRDATLNYSKSGTPVTDFAIATNREFGKVKEVSFIDVTLWGKLGEAIKKYLVKGRQVVVQGYLKQDRWEDNNGNSRSKVKLVAESVQMVGGTGEKKDGQETSEDDVPF